MIKALVPPLLFRAHLLALALIACLGATLSATPALATPHTTHKSTSQPATTRPVALRPTSRPTHRAANPINAANAPHAGGSQTTSRPAARPASMAHRPAPTDPTGEPPGARSTAQDATTENPVSPALTRRNRRKKPKFTSISRTAFFWSQLIGMLVALCVIVLLIYVLLRWAASRMGIQTQTNQRMLRVIDRLSLEPKKGLWIVEAAEQYWLLATHEQGVTLLEQLDAAKVRAGLTPQETVTGGFWERLRRGTPTAEAPADAADAQTIVDPSPEVIPTQFEVVSDGKSSPKETP